MTTPTDPTADDNHLRLLSIFHYVVAAMAALMGCFPFIHVAIGIALLAGAFHDDHGKAPPRFVGLIFIVAASVFILLFWALAVLIFLAGRKLALCRHRMFCLVVAGIECFFMPFGAVLGVFTIIVLLRPSVKQRFDLADRADGEMGNPG